MLTLGFLGSSFSYGSTYILEFRYGEVCTDFQFPDDNPYTGGKALVYQGTAYASNAGMSSSIGTAPPLTVTVTDAFSTTSIGLTGGAMVPYSQFTLDSISVSVDLTSLQTTGMDQVSGSIRAYYTLYSGMCTMGGTSTSAAPFTLDRGVGCPV